MKFSDATILRHIGRQAKRAATYKQLAHEMGVRGEERGELGARLAKLVQRGELVETGGERYALPAAASGQNVVAGRLTMHRDGYGFVIPESDALRGRLSGDIYVRREAVGAAMHGDRVLVEMGPARAEGRVEGRILRVVGRAHATVVGTFHYGTRQNFVTPIDEKITQEIVIPRGLERPKAEPITQDTREKTKRAKRSGPSATAATPHRVLGPEARHRAEFEDLEGVVVDVEITDWPTASSGPRGRVLEILGYENDFGVDVEIVIRKYH
ncbi:MAG: ribonuclease R, partial [Terriglobales bacterium]